MRTEKELLILLRKELIKKYNKGKGYLYLCNIGFIMKSLKKINTDEYYLLLSIVGVNRPLFIDKFNAHDKSDSFWDYNDFHNRYQALSYLIERYEQMDGMSHTQQKEHMTSIASFKRIVLNYIKMLKIWEN